jgi:hypothetical protein
MVEDEGHRLAVERGRRSVRMVDGERLARALAVDLQTVVAGVETERNR